LFPASNQRIVSLGLYRLSSANEETALENSRFAAFLRNATLLSFLIASAAFGRVDDKGNAAHETIRAGNFRVVLQLPEGGLPFGLDLERESSGWIAFLTNGSALVKRHTPATARQSQHVDRPASSPLANLHQEAHRVAVTVIATVVDIHDLAGKARRCGVAIGYKRRFDRAFAFDIDCRTSRCRCAPQSRSSVDTFAQLSVVHSPDVIA
jgi:hypothetical protein